MTDSLTWSVLAPPGRGSTSPPALDAVRRFRGRILWADGLRPSFAGADGPIDADPLDLTAFHVVGARGSVACAPDAGPQATLRVLPLDGDVTGVCDGLLGSGGTARLLERLGLDPAEVWEGSGWAVRPGRLRAPLAATTLAAGAAAARELGRTTLFGASGTRYGQLHRLLSAGFRRAEGTTPVPVPRLADDLQIVHGTLDDLRPEFRRLVDDVAPGLHWTSRQPTG